MAYPTQKLLYIGPLIDYTDDDVKAIYDVNVFSILRVSRAVIPHMAECKKGTIVVMGSVAGELSVSFNPFVVSYT